jgi:hypothetical protein
MSESKHTPGPWRWAGEDYRGGWGWQMLVGPNGEGLIVGQGLDGGVSPHLRGHMPVDPALCITGLAADGKPHAECVHVFSETNARLIAAAPCVVEGGSFLLDRLDDFERAMEANEDTEREWHGHVAPAIARFRAAIAKATGGDQ